MGFAPSTMTLGSTAFAAMAPIPARHSFENENISPELRWEDPPEGSAQFAVICHDPDAPLVSENGTYGFVHWVLYNIPAETRSLDEGSTAHTAGLNNFGESGWGGPLPPEGHGTHHYFFWIIALNKAHNLPEGLSLWEFLAAVEPDIIGMNRLIGTYKRDE